MLGVLETLTCVLSACGLMLVLFLIMVTYVWAMSHFVSLCDRVLDRLKSRSRLAGVLQEQLIGITLIVFIASTFCMVVLLHFAIEKLQSRDGMDSKTGGQRSVEMSDSTSTSAKATWLLRPPHLRAKTF